MRRTHFLVALAFVALSGPLSSCGDDGGPTIDASATVDAPAGNADASTDATSAACSGQDLCERSLGECEVTSITMEQCLAFYEPATTSCEDIAGYTSCNCNCITQPTCQAYFACGQLCFEDWC